MFLHQDRLNFSMDACLLEGIDVEERKSERFEKKYRKVYIYILLNLDKHFFLREELNIFKARINNKIRVFILEKEFVSSSG